MLIDFCIDEKGRQKRDRGGGTCDSYMNCLRRCRYTGEMWERRLLEKAEKDFVR